MASVLEHASTRLRASPRGMLTLVAVDGQGALVTPSLAWRTAAKWAQARQSMGIVQKDIALIVQRLDTAVVRPGTTFAQTTGSAKALDELRRDMRQAGFEIKDWEFPRNLDVVLAAIRGEPAASGQEKAHAAGDGGGPGDSDAPASDAAASGAAASDAPRSDGEEKQ